MPVRVFKEDEKLEIKEKMLSVGFPLLQEYGVTHMSIPKIAKAAGIGTGTFYHFFKSKEDYIYQLIQYKRKLFYDELIPEDIKTRKRKLTKGEIRNFLELIADRKKSVYANMTLSDEANLLKYLKNDGPDLEKETRVADGILQYVEGVRSNIDYAMLANQAKVLAFTAQARTELHAEGYDRTIAWIVDSMMELIFN